MSDISLYTKLITARMVCVATKFTNVLQNVPSYVN